MKYINQWNKFNKSPNGKVDFTNGWSHSEIPEGINFVLALQEIGNFLIKFYFQIFSQKLFSLNFLQNFLLYIVENI